MIKKIYVCIEKSREHGFSRSRGHKPVCILEYQVCTVLVGSSKGKLFKIYILAIWIDPQKQIYSDFTYRLKKFHTISEWPKFDWSFAGNDHTIFKIVR